MPCRHTLLKPYFKGHRILALKNPCINQGNSRPINEQILLILVTRHQSTCSNNNNNNNNSNDDLYT